jgi:hypothetical protein
MVMDDNNKVSLKEHIALVNRLTEKYFDEKVKNVENLIEGKTQNIKEATELAKVEIDRRLQGMNEFREQLSSQEREFIKRSEHANMMEKYDKDLKLINEKLAYMDGRANMKSVMISAGIAIALFLIGIFGHLFSK